MNFPQDFKNKKILIYGLGKTGISVKRFLNKNKIKYLVLDDKLNKNSKIFKKKFDYIILSPGIDIYNHPKIKFFKKHKKNIITDLDIFFSLNKQYKYVIGVTGTNGKSSFCMTLHKILKNNNISSKILGNFGKPVLNEKISKNDYCILELSSYQLDYTKKINLDCAFFLNLSPDHLERHKSLSNYKKIKLKIFSFLNKNGQGFILKDIDYKPVKKTKITKFSSISVGLLKKLFDKNIKISKEDLSISNLHHRNEKFLKKNNFTFINDSKSTNFDSTRYAIKKYKNIILILGGKLKKGDKFLIKDLKKHIFKTYLFGEKIFELKKSLIKQNIKFIFSKKLDQIMKKFIINDYNIYRGTNKNITVLFSPGAASFDQYKNFEKRGDHFKKIVNGIFKR